jgi:hypothetical protein
MVDDVIESTVRQWLREHQGSAHCARCVARDLQLDHAVVRAAMDELAPRQMFSHSSCACGEEGLSYGWSVGPRG